MKQICGGNYEAAMHYDCQICDRRNECPYSKTAHLQYQRTFWVCFILSITIVVGLIAFSIMKLWKMFFN